MGHIKCFHKKYSFSFFACLPFIGYFYFDFCLQLFSFIYRSTCLCSLYVIFIFLLPCPYPFFPLLYSSFKFIYLYKIIIIHFHRFSCVHLSPVFTNFFLDSFYFCTFIQHYRFLCLSFSIPFLLNLSFLSFSFISFLSFFLSFFLPYPISMVMK